MDDKKVYFSPPEEEIIEHLKEIYGIGHVQACEQVIIQKRELAFLHQQRGNYDLAEHLLRELGEWNDTYAESFEQLRKTQPNKNVKIILPNDDN